MIKILKLLIKTIINLNPIEYLYAKFKTNNDET